MRILRFLIGFSATLVCIAVALILAIKFVAPRIIEKLAIEQIAELGVHSADLTIDEISMDRVVIKGLRLGADADLEIPDLRAEFSVMDLFGARMKEIHISGLVLRMKRVDDGLSFGALDPLFLTSATSGTSSALRKSSDKKPDQTFSFFDPENTPAEIPEEPLTENTVERWPVDSIILTDSLIEIKSPFDTTYLPFSGRITQTPDREILLEDTRVEFIHPNIQIKMTVRGRMDAQGNLDASLDINEGLIKFGEIQSVIDGGRFETSGRLDQINSFSAKGGFQISETTMPLGFKPKTTYALALKDQSLTSSVSLEDDEHGIHTSLVAVISEIFSSNPSISIDLQNTVESLRALPTDVGLPDNLDGQGQFDISLSFNFEDFVSLAESTDTESMMEKLPELDVKIHATDLKLDGHPLKAGFEGAFKMNAENNSVSLYSENGLRVVIEEQEPGFLKKQLGPIAQDKNNGPFVYSLINDQELLVLSHQQDSEEITINFSGLSQLSGSYLPDMRGDVDISLALNQNDFSLQWFSVDKFLLGIDPLKIGDGVLSPDSFDMSLNGGSDWATGEFLLHGGFDGAIPGGVDLQDARLNFQGNIGYEDKRLVLSFKDCGSIRAAAVKLSGVIGIDAPMNFCLKNRSTENDLFVLEFDNDGNPSKVHTDLRLIPEYANININPRDAPGFILKGDDRYIEATTEYDLQNNVGKTSAILSGYNVIVPDQRLLIDDISIETNVISRGLDIETVIDIKIGSFIHAVKSPYIAPSSLDLHIDVKNTEASFDGKIDIANGLAFVELEGKHHIIDGKGEALARLYPLNMMPMEKTLQVISPYSAEWVDQIAGMVIGVGIVKWDKNSEQQSETDVEVETDLIIQDVTLRTQKSIIPGVVGSGEIKLAQLGINSKIQIPAHDDMRGTMKLLLENVYMDTDAGRAERINGVINFTSLWPLATKPEQVLSIALIDSGFPLSDGVINFSLNEDGVVDINQILFHLAGGEIVVENMQISPDVPIIQIPLVIRGINATALTDLIPVNGLGATGIINGTIPIEVDDNDFYINQGTLSVDGGGVLSYRPDNAEQTAESNEYMGMALEILSDFHYSDLVMNVGKKRDEDLTFKFKIIGANPAFYDGFPVELRLNVAGEIGKLIRNELTAYSIPDIIKDRIMRFGSP